MTFCREVDQDANLHLALFENEYTISNMEKPKENRGGADRGQGRKPLDAGSNTVSFPVKMTELQREKLGRLGGASWVRQKIDKAKEPKE